MITKLTLDQLRAMKLNGMADTYQDALIEDARNKLVAVCGR